jgi:hypothetical protein
MAQGETLLRGWRASHHRALVLKGEQVEATEAVRQAREAIKTEIVSLADTIRIEFSRDRPLLIKLGLRPQSTPKSGATTTQSQAQASAPAETNGSQPTPAEAQAEAATPAQPTEPATAETKSGKRRLKRGRSQALSAEIARWRQLCANVANLSEAQQAQLAQAGWDAARIEAVVKMIDTLVKIEAAQQVAIQAKLAQFTEAGRQEKELRRWYSRAARLARRAILRHDPTNAERLLKLLGL